MKIPTRSNNSPIPKLYHIPNEKAMKEIPYKNREIDEMFSDIKESLTRIEDQTTKHNGRMSSIEKKQYIEMGAMSVITTILVPILAWALLVLVNIKETVHSSVDQALSAYNINK